MKIPQELIEKYNVPVPRYTSYPPANFFKDDYSSDDYLKAVEESNADKPENISLYFHIPFCPQLCLYCGCNTHITKDKSLMRKYVDAVKKEISLIRPLLNKTRKVSQVHWGGGTPNALPVEMVEEIMELVNSEFQFIEKPEVAVECNPAYLDEKYIEKLVSLGFNRISMGVQDFDTKVLNTVNREIPSISIPELYKMIKSHEGMTVNLDLIYGLPYQTANSFLKAIEQVLDISPERVVTFSYAHVPWVKKSQKALEKHGLPVADEKVKMFENAWAKMVGAGYIPIGLDHYAKPEDEMAKALKTRTLHRNFQGYCTRETTGQVYAFGVTGISQLENAYAQNARTVDSYISAIEKNEIIIEKGYSLNNTEKVIRQVINEIMCNQYLSWAKVANDFNMSADGLKKLLNFNADLLEPFKADNLLTYNSEEIEIFDQGRFFLRNIAALFDLYKGDPNRKFSKSV